MDALRPERGLLGRITLRASQRVVFGVYPDAAPKQILLLPFGANLENVGYATGQFFGSDKFKVIVLGGRRCTSTKIRTRRLRFPPQLERARNLPPQRLKSRRGKSN